MRRGGGVRTGGGVEEVAQMGEGAASERLNTLRAGITNSFGRIFTFLATAMAWPSLRMPKP